MSERSPLDPDKAAQYAAEMANRSAYDLAHGAPETEYGAPEIELPATASHIGEVAGYGTVEAPDLSPVHSAEATIEKPGAHEGGMSLRELIDATNKSAGLPTRGRHAALTTPTDHREGGLSIAEVHARLGGQPAPETVGRHHRAEAPATPPVQHGGDHVDNTVPYTGQPGFNYPPPIEIKNRPE